MRAAGTEPFDKASQSGHIWVKQIAEELGTDRRAAWHALGVVLRTLRDRLTVEDAAHFSAQLPMLVRGTFYEQYRPAAQPDTMRSREEFIDRVDEALGDDAISAEAAIEAVFLVTQRHIDKPEVAKIGHALPEDIRSLWEIDAELDDEMESEGEHRGMKVAEVMTRTVLLASPDEPLEDVAKRMAGEDIGFMPVGENDRLVGMITDRDIVTRALAKGLDGHAPVREAMTRDVKYCFDDDDIESVVQNMGDLQVRRLPVVDHDKRLVGILSLADAAMKHDPAAAGLAMSGIVEPGGLHHSP